MNDIRRPAAVLVPVYRNTADELILVLLRRTEGDIHGGQIAFPGGKYSDEDRTLKETALRETEEETGLKRNSIEILEQLPNVFTQSSHFDITPFLARIIRPEQWKLSEREIAEIFEVKLVELADPKAHDKETRKFEQWPTPKIVPFYRIGKHKLWGATYRILNPILDDLLVGKWKI